MSNKEDGLSSRRQLLIHRALVPTWSLEPKMPHGNPTPTGAELLSQARGGVKGTQCLQSGGMMGETRTWA